MCWGPTIFAHNNCLMNVNIALGPRQTPLVRGCRGFVEPGFFRRWARIFRKRYSRVIWKLLQRTFLFICWGKFNGLQWITLPVAHAQCSMECLLSCQLCKRWPYKSPFSCDLTGNINCLVLESSAAPANAKAWKINLPGKTWSTCPGLGSRPLSFASASGLLAPPWTSTVGIEQSPRNLLEMQFL